MRKALFVRMFLVVWISSAFPLRARDVSARLWDAETGRLLRTFEGFNRPCLEVVFFPDGQQILAGSLTPELRIWNVATGKPAPLFPRSTDGGCRALAISPDGQKMLAASSLGNADIYDPKTGDLIQRLLHGQSGLRNAGFSLNGKLVFFVFDAPPSFAIYDSDAGWALNSFREQTLSHSRYLTLTMNGKAQSWWDPVTGARIRDESKIARQDFRGTASFAYIPAPDLSKLLVWFWAGDGMKRDAHLWDIRSGNLLWTTNSMGESVRDTIDANFRHEPLEFGFSPDGLVLAAANRGGTISLHNTKDGSVVRTLDGRENLEGVLFSPDGKKILGCKFGREKSVAVWDVSSGKLITTFISPAITCAGFSPDGKTIITGGDGEFRGL
jgi:WD40 repeat protein